jgi:hypothetical protein
MANHNPSYGVLHLIVNTAFARQRTCASLSAHSHSEPYTKRAGVRDFVSGHRKDQLIHGMHENSIHVIQRRACHVSHIRCMCTASVTASSKYSCEANSYWRRVGNWPGSSHECARSFRCTTRVNRQEMYHFPVIRHLITPQKFLSLTTKIAIQIRNTEVDP